MHGLVVDQTFPDEHDNDGGTTTILKRLEDLKLNTMCILFATSTLLLSFVKNGTHAVLLQQNAKHQNIILSGSEIHGELRESIQILTK